MTVGSCAHSLLHLGPPDDRGLVRARHRGIGPSELLLQQSTARSGARSSANPAGAAELRARERPDSDRKKWPPPVWRRDNGGSRCQPPCVPPETRPAFQARPCFAPGAPPPGLPAAALAPEPWRGDLPPAVWPRNNPGDALPARSCNPEPLRANAASLRCSAAGGAGVSCPALFCREPASGRSARVCSGARQARAILARPCFAISFTDGRPRATCPGKPGVPASAPAPRPGALARPGSQLTRMIALGRRLRAPPTRLTSSRRRGANVARRPMLSRSPAKNMAMSSDEPP